MSGIKDWQAMQVKCPHGGQMFRVNRVAWEGDDPTFRGTCDCCNADRRVVFKRQTGASA